MNLVESATGLAFLGIAGGLYFFLSNKQKLALVFFSMASLVFYVLIIRFSNQTNLYSPALQLGLMLQCLIPLLMCLLMNANKVVKTRKIHLTFAISGILSLLVSFIFIEVSGKRYPLEFQILIAFWLYWFFSMTGNLIYLIFSVSFFFSHLFCLAGGVYLFGVRSLEIPVIVILFFLIFIPILLQLRMISIIVGKMKKNIPDDLFFSAFVLLATIMQIRFLFV